jgi:hypothetical protein
MPNALRKPELRPDPPKWLSVDRFIMDHGRPPMLERDPVAPWKYRGWLRFTTQQCHWHPGVVNRWGYYLRTREAGKLLDEPIPQMHFSHEDESSPGTKMLQHCIDIIYSDLGSWSAFPALIDWIAWGMAVSGEEARITEKTNEALYRYFNLEPLLLHPADYLGFMYAMGKGRWNPSAFYPTPMTVVHMMTEMVMHDSYGKAGEKIIMPDGRDSRTQSVSDPCVGSGRFPLAASNYSFNLSGCDIDPLCCKMTQINGVLYAPWLTFPFPRSFFEQGPPREEGWAVHDHGQCRLFEEADLRRDQ